MLKVVIADDQENIRKVYAIMLSNYDCQVFEAKTGLEVLRIVEVERPDIIILDQVMPQLTGYEVVQEMKKNQSVKIPVILITGKNFDEGFQNLMKLDVQEFLPKPFTQETLINAMEKTLGHPLPAKTWMKVLLSDDQTAIRQMCALMLADFDCQILEAATGLETLVVARAERPDIVILDHNMPELTGYEVVQEMRKNPELKKIPVVLITGKDFDEGFREIIKFDVQEFLEKPFTADDFIRALEKGLGHPLPPKTG